MKPVVSSIARRMAGGTLSREKAAHLVAKCEIVGAQQEIQVHAPSSSLWFADAISSPVRRPADRR